MGGREGGRERGREGEREGGWEGEREGGRENTGQVKIRGRGRTRIWTKTMCRERVRSRIGGAQRRDFPERVFHGVFLDT